MFARNRFPDLSQGLQRVVAVTGAAGYLGGRLLEHLITQPWVDRVVAFDRLPIVLPAHSSQVLAYQMDVQDTALLRPLLAEHGVTSLIHTAFTITRPVDWTETQLRAANVEASWQVVRTALATGVQHITFVSSVAVYGYHPDRSVVTEASPIAPTMVYGKHKVAVEARLADLGRMYPRARIAIVRAAAIGGAHGQHRTPLWALAEAPLFLAVNGGHAHTQMIHEDDATALIGLIVAKNAAGTFHAVPNDSAPWRSIGALSGRRVVPIPGFVLRPVAYLSNVLPALNGLTPEVADLFTYSLVADNMATRVALGWAPRYGTLDAFADLFKGVPSTRPIPLQLPH